MAHNKYLHEVLVEATSEDIASWMALRQIEAKEEAQHQRKAAARAKAQKR